MPQPLTINGEEYEEVPALAVQASGMVAEAFLRLGKPEDPFSDSGKKMMNVLIALWMDLYSQEAQDWLEARKDYQTNELSISQQVHQQTGRSLASYPYRLYQMMRKVFPSVRFADRETCMKMVRQWPLFRFANKA